MLNKNGFKINRHKDEQIDGQILIKKEKAIKKPDLR